jgi:hypothetical protein
VVDRLRGRELEVRVCFVDLCEARLEEPAGDDAAKHRDHDGDGKSGAVFKCEA